ncbi:MAG: DUF1553 domain-containing protein [Gemmataceae bacterium]
MIRLPLLLALVTAFALGTARAEGPDFARDVLPILSDNCFHCHGPDPQVRKSGLRLDTKEGAFRPRKGAAIIVPGNSGDSELVRRVASTDVDEVMPPPDANRKLTPRQIDTLKRWVESGANWNQHWAFVPLPQHVPVPAVAGALHPIDAFVRARLHAERLTPAPDAPRTMWLRRVTLDLTGLPPTLAEIDAFLADTSTNAYQTVVDRRLASPRYGERMAADWLDAARYADTHGYQNDRFRPMWAYRDWVVRAFDRNQRYDEFLTWQLAGDLLPGATKEQRLATAFNRLHLQNEEGGVVEEEFRVAGLVDRVTTFGTAALGLTLECCRCHDHKFDPIPIKDFYSLFAFFQNIDEAGQTSYFTTAMPVPTLLLSTAEQDARLAALTAKVAATEAEWPALRESARPAFAAWLAARGELPKRPAGLVADYALGHVEGGKVANRVDPAKPGKAHEGPRIVDDAFAELSGENGFTLPGVGHFTRADAFTLALTIRPSAHAPRAVVVHHSKAPVDAGSRGYELLLEDGRVAVGLHHMWPGNSLKVRTKATIPVNAWTHVAAAYDGSSRAVGVRIYLDGKRAELEVIRDGLTKDIAYDGGPPDLAIGYRFRDNGFKGGAVRDFAVLPRAISAVEALVLADAADARVWTKPADDLSAAERELLFDHFLAAVHEPAAAWRKRLRDLRDEERRYVEPIPEAMAMRELPTPKPAYVLKRGAYDAPGERVTADTPTALPPFPAGEPRNRLGLARWLAAPDHPLTARVAVNRLWQQMFGTGLVETSDNFGTTGTPPTHPELLDWLARDFVDHGWDVKRTLRLIALSATYRQSSQATPAVRARDPNDQLLARFPVRRLAAEMLRDQALFVGGLLSETRGGPAVYPYQPDGLWDEAMGRPKYPRSKGGDLYRRSVYTVWKRTAPHPQMTTFDAADRSVCTVRRQVTSSPLQALALLNDPQVVEAARFLGQRTLKEGGATPAERAAWAFRTVTGRSPSEREAAVLVKLFEEQRAAFAANPTDAAKLLAVGDTRGDPSLDPADHAAAVALGLAILNHHEAANRK